MENFLQTITASVGINDILDILIVSFIVYKVLGFIRESRAQQLIKGVLVLLVTFFLSDILNLYTLNWILKGTVTMGVIALVVIFQPELRRGLEYMGRSKIVKAPFTQLDKDEIKAMIDEFVRSVDNFSATKTGALIILERETALSDIAETGTEINADISAELLGNIFYEGAPLHDGAVIIRDDKILAAGCVLPLTENKDLNKSLGTRHRAGIGITENSDAVSIIVSEETGIISIAKDGKLTRFLDTRNLEKTLLNLYLERRSEESSKLGKVIERIGGRNNAGK